METQPLQILLADDDEPDRLLFQDAFSELAVKSEVTMVNSGMELMEMLTTENQRLPHLLFLDLNMPGKSGLDCLKEIRSNERLKNIMIAIYSTSDNERDIEEVYSNGANIYITKPADFSILLQTLLKAVNAVVFHKDKPIIMENFIMRIG